MSGARNNLKTPLPKRVTAPRAKAAPLIKETIRRYATKERVSAHLNLRRILVPVDFSRESAKAMRYAVSLARQFDASIALVHVVEPSYGPDGAAGDSPCKHFSERQRAARAKSRLGALGQRMLGPCRIIETVIRTGLAFFEITEAAKALGTDLIVIGTHGFGGLTRSVMGGTAEKVIRHAPCPVLVVRPNEHEFIE